MAQDPVIKNFVLAFKKSTLHKNDKGYMFTVADTFRSPLDLSTAVAAYQANGAG